VECVARTDGAIDGGARHTADLVDHHLGRRDQTGPIPGRQGDSNSGASTQSDVIGQTVMLACVALNRSDGTTTAGRGLPI
jgi:hypothetical protein